MASRRINPCFSGLTPAILPWRDHVTERLNVRNGIALNRLHDAAFDQGLISFDENLQMILSKQIRDYLPHDSVKSSFEANEGKGLHLPSDAIPPELSFLARHRELFGFQ